VDTPSGIQSTLRMLNVNSSNPKQPSFKKVCGPQEGCCENRCEIQGIAVMVEIEIAAKK